MYKDLIKIIIIVIIFIGSYYFLTYKNVIENIGEMEVNPQLNDSGKNRQSSTLPKYRPTTDNPSAGQPQINDDLKMQEISQKPESYTYDFKPGEEPVKANQLNVVKQNNNVLPYPQISNNYAPQANLNGQFQIKTGTQPSLDCFPKDTVTPQELMPREDPYNTWQLSNPPVNGHMADRNFLESGHHFGIDTVSNSLRNGNKQLRSDPIISQIFT
jgi:hypothetical protein